MITSKFSFQTIHLPPPYAYAYVLTAIIREDGVHIAFDLEYLNRDNLNEEEILEEGFTLEDDFSWEGYLGNNWPITLQEYLNQAKIIEEDPDLDHYLYLELEMKNSKQAGYLKDQHKWEYFLEEMIQAMYEESGREKPLFFSIIDNENDSNYQFQASFAKREFQEKRKKLPWNEMNQIMSWVYLSELDDPIEVIPDKGIWITFDEAQYFELQKKSVQPIRDYLQSL